MVSIVDSGVVVDQFPAMFPGLTRAGTDILASFSTVPDGWPGGCVGVTRSSDEGRSWSQPELLIRPDGRAEAYLNAVGMTTLCDGTILLPINGVRWTPGEGVAGRRISAHLLVSRDGGSAWSRRDVDLDFHAPCVYGGILEVGDALLWPVWGQRRVGERWRSVLLKSVDHGVHWTVGATIGYDENARITSSYAWPESSGLDENGRPRADLTRNPEFRPHSPIDGFSETSVAILDDGSLFAVLRQQGVDGDDTTRLYRARSRDGGLTWDTPEAMGFCGMSPLLHTVNGAVLLATRRRYAAGAGAEPAVEVRVAAADAEEWSAPVALVDPSGTRYTAEYQCGYPAMVTLRDGLVLVLFYGFTADGRRYVASNVMRI